MTEYEIKPKRNFSFGFAELWAYRELFYFFTWRDIKVKYKQTYLGVAWAVLQPFVMMVVFSFFFGRMLKVPSDNIPYPVFVYSGLMLWNVFSTGLSHAGDSMIANSNIIKKIYFPRLIIPMSAILVSVFDFLMAFIVYVSILIFYHQQVNMLIVVLLPAALLITVITCFGLGTLLSAMNVKYRDFRYALPFIIQILMFVSPVIYAPQFSQQWAKIVMSINPMCGAISLLRFCITGVQPDLVMIAISCASSVFLLLIGLSYFRKTESYFADLA